MKYLVLLVLFLAVGAYFGVFTPAPDPVEIKYKAGQKVFYYFWQAKQGQEFDVEIDCLGCCSSVQWCSDFGQIFRLKAQSLNLQPSVWHSGGFYKPDSNFEKGRIRVSSSNSLFKTDWIEFDK